jgi:YVTN family beta-propeller protein
MPQEDKTRTGTTVFRLMLALLAAVWVAGCAMPATQGPAAWPDLIVHLHGSQGKAYLVDPARDAVLAALETAPGGALGSTTPDGRRVYVGSEAGGGSQVTVIDLAQRTVLARVSTGNRPKHPLVSPDGRWVIVNHWGLDGGKLRVSFIATADNRVARTVELDVPMVPPAAMVTSMHNSWSADSRLAFTIDRVGSRLVVVDTRDWSTRSVRTPSIPHYPVPSPDGRELWLVLEGAGPQERAAVLVLDLTRPELPQLARVDMPLTNQGALEGHHGNFSADGSLFYLLNRGPGSALTGNEIVAIDVRTRRVAARAETRSSGIGHAYNTPDGRHVVVTNYGNNTVSVLDARTLATVADVQAGKGRMGHVAFTRDGRYGYLSNAGDGNLHKLDLASMKVVGEIRTGQAPGASQVLNVWTNVFEQLPR